LRRRIEKESMHLLISFAGVPRSLYDDIYKKRQEIFGSGVTAVGVPLPVDVGGPYTENYINTLLKRVGNTLEEFDKRGTTDLGIGIIYLDYSSGTENRLVERFFPFALCVGIEEFTAGAQTGMSLRISKNELAKRLRHAAGTLRDTVPVIKKFVQSDANTTPILLPVRNFKSSRLRPMLSKVVSDVSGASDKMSVLREIIEEFKRHYPRTKIEGAARKCFVDDRGIAFNPPGSALHGFARGAGGNGHNVTCWLAARLRLGAPYHRAYHYDCTAGGNRLEGYFYDCHDSFGPYRGNPHLNIAPNDYVRP
jgi:hypothetical protein